MRRFSVKKLGISRLRELRRGRLIPSQGACGPPHPPAGLLVWEDLNPGWGATVPSVGRGILSHILPQRSGPGRCFALVECGSNPNSKRARPPPNPNPQATPRGTQP